MRLFQINRLRNYPTYIDKFKLSSTDIKGHEIAQLSQSAIRKLHLHERKQIADGIKCNKHM